MDPSASASPSPPPPDEPTFLPPPVASSPPPVPLPPAVEDPPAPTAYDALDDPELDEVVPDALAKRAAAQDEKEAQLRATLIAAAADEMASFAKQREAGRLSQQEKNRQEETIVLETIESEREVKGNPWVRVAQLVDMTVDPKVKPEDDTTARMRSILIRLKTQTIE